MRLKVKIVILSNRCNFDLSLLFCLEQPDTSKDQNEITGLPSACDQSTQTEDVLNLTETQSKKDTFEEQGTTLPCHLQNETEV